MAEGNGSTEASELTADASDETEISEDTVVELTADGREALRLLHRSGD